MGKGTPLYHRAVSVCTLAASLFAAGACGGGGGEGDGGGGGGPTTPSPSIAKAPPPNGDSQADTVRATLPESLRVLVTEDGAPKAGVAVSWSSLSGGNVSPATSLTDASGIAATRWTLSQTSGTQGVSATLPNATGSPVTFLAVANAGAAASLSKVIGDSQYGFPSFQVRIPPTVKVVDQFGNGVSTQVNWSAPDSAALLADTVTASNAAGFASTIVTAGNLRGWATIRATAPALPGASQDFALLVTPTVVAVYAGNEFFENRANNTRNPAVDSIPLGGVVSWSLVAGGHSVHSVGTPSFTSSGLLSASSPYRIVFTEPGTYQYDCGVHGPSMTGVIIVFPF